MIGRRIIKWIMLASNLVVVFVMLLTLLGTVLSPSKVVFPAYFALLFPLTIVLNIAFVVFWALVRKWYFLLSLSLLVLSAHKINDVFPVHFGKTQTVETDDSSDTFTILSYNTMMCGKLVKHTKRNSNNVIQYMLDSDADILCIQEFTVSKKDEHLTESDIIKAFKKYPYKHIQYKQELKYNRSGVATFSKYPIVNKQTIDYKSDYNVSIFSDIDINGKMIRVFNNHLESNRLTESDKALPSRLKNNFDTEQLTGITLHFSRKLATAYRLRAKQADAVAAAIAESPYKVVVCGDLNDVPTSYAYTRIKGDLKDAFSETGTGFGLTFNERFYRFRIDYVFYNPVVFSPVLFYIDKVDYSDHYPLFCKLRINDK